jgi:4-alpha-glucanotransferase
MASGPKSSHAHAQEKKRRIKRADRASRAPHPGRDAPPAAGARALTFGERASGVLLHPTSLPGRHGSGDLGPEARRFVDFLAAAGQRWWQTLPVGPPGYGDSPYSAHSAFAGNPMLVSLDALVDDGLLDRSDVDDAFAFPSDHVAFGAVAGMREPRLARAHAALLRDPDGRLALAFRAYCDENDAWLDDWALFCALKRAHGGAPWTAWEKGVRARRRRALAEARERYREEMSYHRFVQFAFDRQWSALRAYAADRGVGLIGDIPIFVAHDSADVWQNQREYHLDEQGMPTAVAGVPPDYFSATGQRWGNPLYRWKRMKKSGFAFWVDRIRVTLKRFDAVRLDHFIGFSRYWAIPASCPTAIDGRYAKGPGASLFKKVRAELGALPLIAEDLGVVTPKVKALRDRFDLPGIRVLQFAFGDDPSAPDFMPYNYPRGAVVYTGTHDNDTTVGWFRDEGGEASTRTSEQIARERQLAIDFLGSDGREIHWDMIRAVLASVADTAVVPAQDLLGLGSEARMNRPGVASGNWAWRAEEGAFSEAIAGRLGKLTRLYGRAAAAPLPTAPEESRA